MPPPPATASNVSFVREAIWACLPATTRGQPVQIDAHPKGTSFMYTNGRTVIIRDLLNPEISTEYCGHSFPVTVARFSPSGFYVASGDVRGHVRIWDCTQPEQILKAEYQVLSGPVLDVCWDAESKRIIAVGDGREKYGHAFFFDSGSSVGEIVGHSKTVNSVSIRPIRPFRAVTCSDDMTVNFYNGVPYKFVTSITDHSRFVTAVRFAPSGAQFASVAMDGKVFLYDGSTGEKIKEIVDATGHGHTGGIFALAWSPDSTQFITSSADCTVKLWDVETSKVVQTWSFDSASSSPNPMNHQVGNLWRNEYVLTVSLSGDVHYLNPILGTIERTIHGHQKSITALAYDGTTRTLVTGSYDGVVCAWLENDVKKGARKIPVGNTMSQVQSLSFTKDDNLTIASVHLDDTLRTLSLCTTDNTDNKVGSVKLSAQPTGVVVANGGVKYVITVNGVIAVENASSKSEKPVVGLPSDVTALAISPDRSKLAVGTTNREVVMVALEGTSGKVDKVLGSANNSKGAVTSLAFDPIKGDMLAVGDTVGKIVVYDVTKGTPELKLTQWAFHTARITNVSWHPSGTHVVSTSLDTSIGIWSVAQPMSHVMIRNSHVDATTAAVWVGDDRVASVGSDACVKHWKIVKMPGA